MGNLHCIALLHADSQAQSDAQPPIKASALETCVPMHITMLIPTPTCVPMHTE